MKDWTGKQWRMLARVLHRDFGFFFAGVTLLYAISGIAVNHVDSWDPSFVIERREVELDLPQSRQELTTEQVVANLERLGIADSYRTHDFPSALRVKIYLENGSIVARFGENVGEYETIRRRPLFYHVNFLHLNPAGWWMVFSDLFAIGLIVVAITGLFLTRGRLGLAGRGGWLLTGGVAVPLLALIAFT